jgi:NTE family protein
MKPNLKADLVKVLHSVLRGIRKFGYSRPASNLPVNTVRLRPRIGLALGGGFARGIAHAGVLKVFIENGIPVDAIAGTSAGSIAAAAFASGCTVEEMLAAVRKLRWNKFARWTFSRMGFASNERMESLLHELFRCRTFEQTRIPLAIVAADLGSGEAVTFRQGSLILPVRASCCFPGLFVPVEYRGRRLVDGVVVASVPVAPLHDMGADVIVGVHLRAEGSSTPVTNLFQVVGESFQIMQDRNQSNWRSECDLVIEPKVLNFRWDEFERADELVAAGEAAARAVLPELRRLLEDRAAQTKAVLKRGPGVSTPVLEPHASS